MLTIDARMIYASGIGTYIRNLVPRIVSGLPDTDITIIGNKADLAELKWGENPRVSIKDCQAPIYSIQEQWAMWRAIPKATKLLWVPHYPIPIMYSGKLVVTVHDLFHLANSKIVRGLDKKLYSRTMFCAVSQKADAVLCPSEFTKSEYMRLLGWPRQPLTVIPNGIDHSTFYQENPEPAKFSVPYFICVGNVKPHKNLGTLLKAFSTIKDTIDHRLVIVGKQSGFITGDNSVIKAAESLGDRAIFTGHISDELLRQFISGATALVFPSLYEGFGLPVIEAMACGCPVIASSIPPVMEVGRDAAVYFDSLNAEELAEKMLLIASNKAVRAEKVEQGLAISRLYSWDICAQKTLQVLKEILER
jgi:glycosyltransferase involved in cell wall biosynthesis